MYELLGMTRRKVLTGLAGASVLVLAGACSETGADKKSSEGNAPKPESKETAQNTSGSSGASGSSGGETGGGETGGETKAEPKTGGKDRFAEMTLGNPDAPVTIIAYESLTCPHCASFHANTLPQIKKNYIETGKVKFIMRDFPFDRLSLTAHMAARCAGPDVYFALVELLFGSQGTWVRAQDKIAAIGQIARIGGLSDEEYKACISDQKLTDFIVQRIEEGNKKYGVTSTPTFIINGKKSIVGAQPYEEFEKVLKPLVN